MKRLLVLMAALAVAGCDVRADPVPLSAIRISAEPIPLDPKAPDHRQIGDFTYAGGVALTSGDTARLHGLSDFRINADGQMTAVSDDGDLMRARLVLNPDTTVAGLADGSIETMKDAAGAPFASKTEADAEGVAIWPNGDMMVSFERNHRIVLYPANGGAQRLLPTPDIRRMPENRGMEGLALAPSRGPDAYWVGVEDGTVWLCRLSSGCEQQPDMPKPAVELLPPYVYRLSALTETARGELVVLHHGFNGVDRSRIRLFIFKMAPGGAPRLLDKLELGDTLSVDNFEGVDVAELPGGGLRIFLMSDDNFSPGQRTLLSAFDWRPARR